MKLHRKVKHNKKVCRAHELGSYAQGLSNNSKTTEANIKKLHRKIEHNEKVCHTQVLGSYAQGQGPSVTNHVSAIAHKYWTKFDETSQKGKA